jgi:multicomponent Na+:H+ antiporter subunit D
MNAETLIACSLLAPLTGAVFILLTGSKPDLRDSISLVTSGLLFITVISLIPHVMAGSRPSLHVVEILPDISIGFEIEPIGILFASVASLLWIASSIYSIGYMRGNNESHQTRFYVFFAVALASTIGIAFASNLLTLFIFYEFLTLSTYPLVTHQGSSEAMRAGRLYLGLLLSTSIGLFLIAIIWTWQIAGTLEFTGGGILSGRISGVWVAILLFLYMYGIGKAALMPVHRWLPAAMIAPTPVSALLHAVAVVKAGVFSIVKIIVYIFGPELLANDLHSGWLVYIAGATIVIASIIALRSDNLKRLLAYSTISQLSYVIIAAAILAPLSILGAVLHLATHAFGKITLFFAAGSIYTATKKTEISQLNGIGYRMPWTMAAFTIGSLSMIGVPPTAGFISKWYILQGAIEMGSWFSVSVIVVSTLLNAAYFLPIVYAAFFRKDTEHDNVIKEAPLPIMLALGFTALGTIVIFMIPDTLLGLAQLLQVCP